MQSLLGVVSSKPHWRHPPLSLSPGLIEQIQLITSSTVIFSFLSSIPFLMRHTILFLIYPFIFRSIIVSILLSSYFFLFYFPFLLGCTVLFSLYSFIFRSTLVSIPLPFIFWFLLYYPFLLCCTVFFRLYFFIFHVFLVSVRLSFNSSLVQTNFSVVLISLSISSLALIVVVYDVESYA